MTVAYDIAARLKPAAAALLSELSETPGRVYVATCQRKRYRLIEALVSEGVVQRSGGGYRIRPEGRQVLIELANHEGVGE